MVCSTGTGSARPVVSSTTRRNTARPLSRSRSNCSSASTRSPRKVQHRQPLCSSTTPSLIGLTSRWSSPISPNSLMITAVSASAGSVTSRLSSEVLPAPRKPVSTVRGMGSDRAQGIFRKGGHRFSVGRCGLLAEAGARRAGRGHLAGRVCDVCWAGGVRSVAAGFGAGFLGFGFGAGSIAGRLPRRRSATRHPWPRPSAPASGLRLCARHRRRSDAPSLDVSAAAGTLGLGFGFGLAAVAVAGRGGGGRGAVLGGILGRILGRDPCWPGAWRQRSSSLRRPRLAIPVPAAWCRYRPGPARPS